MCPRYVQITPERNVYNMQMTQHYAVHAQKVNDMHLSTVLRKISNQFREGQIIQILFLTVKKRKLWSYYLHKCQKIANLKKKE